MLDLNLFKNKDTKRGNNLVVNSISVDSLELNQIKKVSSNDVNYIVSIPTIECGLRLLIIDSDLYTMKYYLPDPLYIIMSLINSQDVDPSLIDLNFDLPTEAGYYLLTAKDNSGHESTCTLSVSKFSIEILSGNIGIDVPFTFNGILLFNLDMSSIFGSSEPSLIIALLTDDGLKTFAVFSEGVTIYNGEYINTTEP